MCEFKFCRGAGACFLKDVSPCPGKCATASRPGRVRVTSRDLGLRYDGFLDRDFVIEALGFDDPAPDHALAPAQPAEVLRAEPKRARAVPMAGPAPRHAAFR